MLDRRVATSSLSCSTAVKQGVPCKNLLRRCWSYANLDAKCRWHFEGMSTASDGPQIEPSWSAQVCPGDFGSEIMHITHFMSIMQFIAIMQVYINTSKNTGGSVSSHSLISTSCCLNVVVSSCKLHSLLHSDRTIWRMWNYHRSRDSRASTLVFEGWRASILVIEVLWWSSIIVEMLNRRFFVVRIDIIWKRGLIMHKLCTLCNLCKLLHSYVIYAFYVTDCIIMQIMNIPCIFLHSGQN